MIEIHKPKISQLNVSQDNLNVVLVLNGQRILELKWDAALMVARAISIKAHEIEEQVKAPMIAFDQALLMRKGLPLGLTSNPVILGEARKEAAHNTKLRKYIPHVDEGIRSREALGTPRLIKHRRRENG